MLNNKFITIGIIAVIVLVALYLGNMAIRTTPEGGAGGTYQYKVVGVPPEEKMKLINAFVTSGLGAFGNPSDPKVLEEAKKVQTAATSIIEKVINETAKDGWEYVGTLGADGTFFVFKKK